MLHDRKAQAGTAYLARTRFIDPIESLEDPGTIFRGNSDPGVGHPDFDLMLRLIAHLDMYFAIRFIELDRVVQKVQQRLLQPEPMSRYPHIRNRPGSEMHAHQMGSWFDCA